jgi:hypothetical protein
MKYFWQTEHSNSMQMFLRHMIIQNDLVWESFVTVSAAYICTSFSMVAVVLFTADIVFAAVTLLFLYQLTLCQYLLFFVGPHPSSPLRTSLV